MVNSWISSRRAVWIRSVFKVHTYKNPQCKMWDGLLKDTLGHFWLWSWLPLNRKWEMWEDALCEFMTVVHLIFVRSGIFFTVPQHLHGQFDIITLPIWTFDKVSKIPQAYMIYRSIRLFYYLHQSATTSHPLTDEANDSDDASVGKPGVLVFLWMFLTHQSSK